MSGSVAIVTGSSSGIGRATAIRLARDFSAVVLAARETDALAKVAQDVKANGAVPLQIDLDLMAPGAAETVVGRTLAEFGRIDALLDIAGAKMTPTEAGPTCPYEKEQADEGWSARAAHTAVRSFVNPLP
jgi:NADP-dependent 3-hydroxy acid dehydrogenase YdfG